MADLSRQEIAVLALIPVGGLILYLFNKEVPANPQTTTGKEAYYLRFNKDELFKNLLAAEGHFRNISDVTGDTKGFTNCSVKHLAEAESHADEAVCHSLIVADAQTSEKYKKLAEAIKELRHDVQDGNVKASDGIERVRKIRREFEGFNPDFDINKCEACTVKA